MGAVIDLEELPITDSIEMLREHMLRAPVPLALEPDPGRQLIVRSRVADLGCVHLLCTKAQGGDVIRTRQLSRDGTRPSLMVSVIDYGTATIVRDDDEITTLRAGDIGLYLTDEPYRISFSPGSERLTFQVPLDVLGLPPSIVTKHLRQPITPELPSAAAVSGFLRSAARAATRAGIAEQEALEQPTIQLIRFLLTRVDAAAPTAREAAATSLAARIEEHVKTRLGDEDLSARSIADAFSISERYVYVILARRNIDLGDAIRRHRMDRAVRLLEDPAESGSTIGAIASRAGFTDHSHFTRAFRHEFGVTPSDWRERATGERSG